jgi:hypothetical protein
MSNAFLSDGASSSPEIPTLFTADSGTAVPAANNLNILSSTSVLFSEEGIRTTGSGSTITVVLTNRISGQVSTTDATPTSIITLDLGLVSAVYAVTGYVVPIVKSGVNTGDGASYYFDSAFKTDGATATKIASEENTNLEDASLVDANISSSASGNDFVLSVVGIAGTDMNWDAVILFRRVV